MIHLLDVCGFEVDPCVVRNLQEIGQGISQLFFQVRLDHLQRAVVRLGSVADLEEQFILAMPYAFENAADLAEFFGQADVVEEQVDDEAFLVVEGALKTLEVREAATMLQEPWFGSVASISGRGS